MRVKVERFLILLAVRHWRSAPDRLRGARYSEFYTNENLNPGANVSIRNVLFDFKAGDWRNARVKQLRDADELFA